MTNLYPRGSEWRKWDLHIHSTASDGHATPREILEEARNKGLSVIALTDHHCVDNIDEIKKIAAEEFKDITVISGIEFRSEYGESSVHFIGLFPDKFKKTTLDSTALKELILNKLQLSRTHIISKAREEKENENLGDNEAFKKGLCKVQVDLKEAANLIHQYGGIVTIHHGSKNNGLDKEVKHFGKGDHNVHDLYDSLGQLKDELLNNYVDICEISKAGDNSKWYLDKYGKTSIIASDAHRKEGIHNENTHENGVGDRFTWIKADPTFEGLKQIIYEPVERVCLQDYPQELKSGYDVIDKIILSGNDFGNQEIPINQNLVTIIGGRSSGKSTLLEGIARAINPERCKIHQTQVNNSERESFFTEISKEIKIYWKDNNDEIRDIDYYYQEYMYEIARDKNESDGLISRIILEDYEFKEFYKELNKFKNNNQIYLETKSAKFSSLLSIMKENQKPEGDKKGIEDEISHLKQELDSIRKSGVSLTEDEQNKYNEIVKQIKNAKTSISEIESDIREFDELTNEDIISQAFLEKVSRLTSSIGLEIKHIIDEHCKKIIDKVKFIIFEKQLILYFEKTKKENFIVQLENEPLYHRGCEVLLENNRYNELYKKLENEEDKLKALNQWEEKQTQLAKEIKQCLLDLKHAQLQYQQNYINKEIKVNDEIIIKAIKRIDSVKMTEFFLKD